MSNLLNTQESRRLKFVLSLADEKDWVTLAELAQLLECSSRVLKEDIRHINAHSNCLKIETSTLGVRVIFDSNKDVKHFCQEMLIKSPAYQLIETIFLNSNQTAHDLAKMIYVSPTTLYRMINQLNPILQAEYNFQIETNPCRFVGDEKKIRQFFYVYIFERYSHFDSTLIGINEEVVLNFLKEILVGSPILMDFSFYNVTRVVMLVNLIRYKNNEFLEIDETTLTKPRKASNFDGYSELFKHFEEPLGITINSHFITQVFTPYIQKGFSDTYEEFIEATKQDSGFLYKVTFLRALLDDIAARNSLVLENKEALVMGLFNTLHLEYQDPQSDYILYNRNQRFSADIAHEFPQLYQDLYEGMKEFRKVLGRETTKEGIAFFIYNIFATWKNLVPQLRQKVKKIRTLVISDRHQAHAEMVKDFIAYDFSEQVTVDFFNDLELNPTVLEELDYDLIVTTFPVGDLENRRNVYIPNVPKYTDYIKIQHQIDAIINERLSR